VVSIQRLLFFTFFIITKSHLNHYTLTEEPHWQLTAAVLTKRQKHNCSNCHFSTDHSRWCTSQTADRSDIAAFITCLCFIYCKVRPKCLWCDYVTL